MKKGIILGILVCTLLTGCKNSKEEQLVCVDQEDNLAITLSANYVDNKI